MNKQELIDYCNVLKENKNQFINCIDVNRIIKKIEQLDEPEKVKVPQFVADWIEESKQYCKNVVEFFGYKYPNIELIKYFNDRENINLVALAWLDGYEVEKEKRYWVKMKGLSECHNYLNYDSLDDEWYFTDAENGPVVGTHHTRKKFEQAGFGWVFDCEGIEIKEVKE